MKVPIVEGDYGQGPRFCLGVVAGIGVVTLMLTAGAHPAHCVVAGGTAFVAVVSLALKVFTAMAWL